MKFTAKHKDFDKLLDVTCINITGGYITVDFSDEDVLRFVCDNDLGTISLDDVDLFLDGEQV